MKVFYFGKHSSLLFRGVRMSFSLSIEIVKIALDKNKAIRAEEKFVL
jgi:hypothetical protein